MVVKKKKKDYIPDTVREYNELANPIDKGVADITATQEGLDDGEFIPTAVRQYNATKIEDEFVPTAVREYNDPKAFADRVQKNVPKKEPVDEQTFVDRAKESGMVRQAKDFFFKPPEPEQQSQTIEDTRPARVQDVYNSLDDVAKEHFDKKAEGKDDYELIKLAEQMNKEKEKKIEDTLKGGSVDKFARQLGSDTKGFGKEVLGTAGAIPGAVEAFGRNIYDPLRKSYVASKIADTPYDYTPEEKRQKIENAMQTIDSERKETSAKLRGYREKIKGKVDELIPTTPEEESRFGYKLFSGFASLPKSLVPGLIGTEVYASSYDEAIDQGKTEQEANRYALKQSSFQELSERIGSHYLNKTIKGGKGIVKSAIAGFYRESTQEIGQEVGSIIIEKLDKVEGGGNIPQRLFDSWLIGGLTGGIFTGAGSSINSIPQSLQDELDNSGLTDAEKKTLMDKTFNLAKKAYDKLTPEQKEAAYKEISQANIASLKEKGYTDKDIAKLEKEFKDSYIKPEEIAELTKEKPFKDTKPPKDGKAQEIKTTAETLKDYEPESSTEITTPILEKLKGETTDQAVARKVGYQIDNGSVKLEETKDGWKATIAGIEKPKIIQAFNKQQVLNQAYSFLNPSYGKPKYQQTPAKPEGERRAPKYQEAKSDRLVASFTEELNKKKGDVLFQKQTKAAPTKQIFEIAKGRKFLKEIWGIDIDKVKGTYEITTPEGKKASGAYADDLIYIAHVARETTAYHESFHMLTKKFIDDKIYNAAVEDIKVDAKKANLTPDEYLAEEFAKYKNKRESVKGKIRKMFDQLIMSLKRVFSKQKYAKRLFNDLEKGKGIGVPKMLANVKYQELTPKQKKDVSEYIKKEINRELDEMRDEVKDYRRGRYVKGKTVDSEFPTWAKDMGLNSEADALAALKKGNKNFTESMQMAQKRMAEGYKDVQSGMMMPPKKHWKTITEGMKKSIPAKEYSNLTEYKPTKIELMKTDIREKRGEIKKLTVEKEKAKESVIEERIDVARKQKEIEGNKQRIKELEKIARIKEIKNRPVQKQDGSSNLEISAEAINNSLQGIKDAYFGGRDTAQMDTQVEARLLRQELSDAINEKKGSKKYTDTDQAIQIYLDLKRDPDSISEYYDKLTEDQQQLVDLAKTLPDNVKIIANKLRNSYDKIGIEALNAEIISNTLDNYVARVWDIEGKAPTEAFRKLSSRTKHAKQRVFSTILEGMSLGYNLKIKGAINNLELLKTEITKTIADKAFIKAMQKGVDIDGNPLTTTKHLDGYIELEHPSFVAWKSAGIIKEGATLGKNFLVTEDGSVLEKQKLYAPKDIANRVNNIFGRSKLKNQSGSLGAAIKEIDTFNAHAKAWILQTSFFHHMAFMRSYYLGTSGKKWKDMSARKAYKEGLRSIEQSDPIIRLGVKNGLTLGLQQEWQKELLQEKTRVNKILDKWKVTKAVGDKIAKMREAQADFLFGEFGAGLKAKAFMIEYAQHTKKHPELTADEAARHVANLMNDDFGGLHLERLERNPTLQHIFRIFSLAPDWTESNIRSMAKAVKAGGKAETNLYRRFWTGVAVKGAVYSMLANMAMAAIDEDDEDTKSALDRFIRNYRRAWKEGHLRWTGVDITPLYRLMGGDTKRRKYFGLIGHFKDPLKFISHPLTAAKHKSSVIGSVLLNVLTGSDWAGRKYTSVQDLFKEGKLVEFSYAGSKALSYEQIPSFIASKAKDIQPVQFQNLVSWLGGETEGFDALFNSMGLGISTTYGKDDFKKLTPREKRQAEYKQKVKERKRKGNSRIR